MKSFVGMGILSDPLRVADGAIRGLAQVDGEGSPEEGRCCYLLKWRCLFTFCGFSGGTFHYWTYVIDLS